MTGVILSFPFVYMVNGEYPFAEALHFPHVTSGIPSCKQQKPPLAAGDL